MATATDIELTPETILAVARHMKARRNELERTAQAARPDVYCSAYVFANDNDKGIFDLMVEFKPSIGFRRDGLDDWTLRLCGDDFDALVDEGKAKLAEYAADLCSQYVEPMALAIIKIKHASGTVTDRDLRLADFPQRAIEAVHERAAALANEMSDGKPFSVEFVGASNHEVAA